MLRSAPERYEEFVLAACLTDEKLWNSMKGVVCIANKGNYTVNTNDFTSQERYWLYCAIKYYRKALGKFAALNDSALLLGAQFATTDGIQIPTSGEQYDSIVKLFHNLQPISKENAQAVVADTWISWSTYNRLNYHMADIKRGGFTGNIMEKADMLAKIKSDITTAAGNEENVVSQVDDIWILEEDNTERIPLGRSFKALMEITGGGLGKGEHVLAAIPTGGGKTVFSCQLAGEVAASGRHVLLISTEQHAKQLMPRIVSCLSWVVAKDPYDRIPSKPIKDGITKAKVAEFSQGQLNVFNQIHDAIAPYLHIASWNGQSYTISDIPNILNEENRKLPEGEQIDLVILDWIGGAITKGITDSGQKRLILFTAAQQMHLLAEQYNVACLSTCQTSEKGKHVWDITSEHIADAKNLSDEAEVAFGISCMPANPEKELPADGASVYSVQQRLNCWKARKAEAKKLDVKRNFAFQRFDM